MRLAFRLSSILFDHEQGRAFGDLRVALDLEAWQPAGWMKNILSRCYLEFLQRRQVRLLTLLPPFKNLQAFLLQRKLKTF